MSKLREVIQWVLGLIPPGAGLLARPRGLDLLIAVVLAAGSLLEYPLIDQPRPIMDLAAGLALAAIAIYRRVRPLAAVIAVTAVGVGSDIVAGITDQPVAGTIAGGLAVVVITYTVGRWAPRNTVVASILIMGLILPSTGFLNSFNDPAWVSWLIAASLSTASIGTGVLVRARDVLRTEQARAELAEERNHLANDIHDSVAHAMSAIAIRAEGARHLSDQTQRDQAFDAIARTASKGLTDVRHLIANIRTNDDLPEPLPGLGDLNQLAQEATTPSLEVEVMIDAVTEAVPVTVSAVAYAITREALTNIRRHATGASRAVVRARTTDQYLDLTIVDDGSTPATRTATAGFGLQVMTERATSVGGNLTAGPDPNGGWLVASRLPLTSGASQ
ncbi:MAG: histidine kinase [Actinomycetota bacterium]